MVSIPFDVASEPETREGLPYDCVKVQGLIEPMSGTLCNLSGTADIVRLKVLL